MDEVQKILKHAALSQDDQMLWKNALESATEDQKAQFVEIFSGEEDMMKLLFFTDILRKKQRVRTAEDVKRIVKEEVEMIKKVQENQW